VTDELRIAVDRLGCPDELVLPVLVDATAPELQRVPSGRNTLAVFASVQPRAARSSKMRSLCVGR
jgi:hypothetical protein